MVADRVVVRRVVGQLSHKVANMAITLRVTRRKRQRPGTGTQRSAISTTSHGNGPVHNAVHIPPVTSK